MEELESLAGPEATTTDRLHLTLDQTHARVSQTKRSVLLLLMLGPEWFSAI